MLHQALLICAGIFLFARDAFIQAQLLDYCSETVMAEYINRKDIANIRHEKIQVSTAPKSSRGLTEVANYFGMTSLEDIENFHDSVAECCKQSDLCHGKGGWCMPSWLKQFFPCYDDKLCMSHDTGGCTCILPPSECPCNGTCTYNGTCKSSCSLTENLYPDNSCGGDNGGCGCCVQCMGSCGVNGYCRKVCNFLWETQVGTCMGSSNCRCCRRCEGSCGGNGICRKICLQTEYQDGSCMGTTGCKCCKKTGNDCSHVPCGRYGVCASSCPMTSIIIGKCSGNCVCCAFYTAGDFMSVKASMGRSKKN